MPMIGCKGGQLELFTKNQIYGIHVTSLNILENVGVVMADADTLKLMESAGADVDYKNSLVKIPQYLVLEALAKTPRNITLYGRKTANDIVLSEKMVYNGSANNATAIMGFDGVRRAATFRDLEDFTRLQDALENVHIMSTPITRFKDTNAKSIYKRCYEAVVRNTEKHIISQADGPKEYRDELRIAAAVMGVDIEDVGKRPTLSMIADLAPPLKFPKTTLDVIVESAKYHIPILLETDPSAGGTAPVTAVGLITQQNAEILAGITLAQLVRPNTPIIYTNAPHILDMKTASAALGAPECGIFFAATAQLCRYYGIPMAGVAGTTDSKLPDLQAGYEKAISYMMAALAGYNIISAQTGMLETNLTVNYEQSVIDNEIFGMVFRVLRGAEVSEKSLLEAFQLIKAVGPLGGHYLTQEHTRRNFLIEEWQPTVSDRNRWDVWVMKGKKGALDLARQKAKDILQQHKIEPPPTETLEEIGRIAREDV
jgi:trimethylamine--corrinoid protein Co-methyltransferase